eukprot:ctg_653.g280
MDDERALANLKYLLMCKLMIEQVPELTALLQGRVALKYQGREVDAMRALAAAYEKRSVHELQRVLDTHRDVLTEDPVIQAHLEDLYGALLERNLLRIIEPYSRLQLTHIAERMDLPVEQVEAKCSQLILDGKLNGILDQGAGSLILHGEEPADDLCSDALQTVQSLNEVADARAVTSDAGVGRAPAERWRPEGIAPVIAPISRPVARYPPRRHPLTVRTRPIPADPPRPDPPDAVAPVPVG